ncbi:MAG TPA: GNAT family N-acetyltransferase [Acidobacteriaceae bacterium]|nr:GNAT family N-acetyltransferase [Acidobacteriaceae bacterium]
MTGERSVEKLRRDHPIGNFDCGKEDLNSFLLKHALQSQSPGASTTYLALVNKEVVGYYSLAVGQIEYADAPERLRKGLAKHPVPVMLLARLAVASAWQRIGVGKGLLKDAIERTLQAADIVGIRGIAVHARDDEARKYYEQFDFAPSLSDPMHLIALLKDIWIRL